MQDHLNEIDFIIKKGIDLAFYKGVHGETYNIGGRNEKKNIDIAHIICSILDDKKPLLNIQLSSDLKGIEMSYPAPFNKARDKEEKFYFTKKQNNTKTDQIEFFSVIFFCFLLTSSF